MKKLNVLSLFDGLSCGQIALERVKIPIKKYFASEIDKYAIAVTQENYSNTIQLGDITKIKVKDLPEIDLLMGGFPCQDLSIAKKDRKGLKGKRSGLFYEMIKLHKKLKPKWFLYENVASMSKENKKIITDTLKKIDKKTYCIEINSSLLSAQNRKRLYWTNIQGVDQPKDKGILLKDILEKNVAEKYYLREKNDNYKSKVIMPDKSYCIEANYYKGTNIKNYFKRKKRQIITNINSAQSGRVYSTDGKSTTLNANGGGQGAKTGLYKEINRIRRLTPIECERLQTVPDNYTLSPHPVYKNKLMSDTQRYKMLGNGFTVDVIAHILKGIKNEIK